MVTAIKRDNEVAEEKSSMKIYNKYKHEVN